ncbi:MAG TPA: S8 family serine peptidase [Gaiellaceae bacterium]|nr:S8 family serine peptidase [Gaiellaceae bacterium]
MKRGLGAALSALAILAFAGAAAPTHASQPLDYKPGELLVRFDPSSSQLARADALGDLDAAVVQRLPLSGLVRVRLEPGTSVEAAAEALERRPEVRYAHPNHVYRLAATPNDPSFLSGALWGLHQPSDADIDAPEGWDVTHGSDAVTVAVVDSGIDYNHEDLQANMWAGRGWDFVNGDNDPMDDNGHGTHVAGTIGARGNNGTGITGVNWRVKLMAVKAGDEDGFLEESWIVQAFQYACANGARVINGSFGGPGSTAIRDAINACPNALFVFAAGNGGWDGIGDNNDAAPVYPCSFPSANIICVAATSSTDARAGFSNYGVNNVDIGAPGVDVRSTVPLAFDGDGTADGYDSWDGTSMASPHVAGAAALVLAARPALSVAELRRAVLLAAEPKPSLNSLVATGGRLNVRNALSQEVTPPAGLAAQSSSPSFNTWSNVNTTTASWGGATDESGIDGYSFAWSPDATFSPDEVKDVEENVTSVSTALPDGRHWFHVRARDGAGNWAAAIHLGPFLIDTFPAARPTLSSPSHRAGVASTDRTVEVNWITLGDSISGSDGFSFAWSRQQLVTVDQTKEVEEDVFRTTSTPLEPGAWWFGIRARDNAGNWTDATVIGPFVVTGTAPVCTVPRLRGLTLAAAKRSLRSRGCRLGRVTKAYSRRVRRGRLVAQRPGPGLRLRRGAKIAVVLSRGSRRR